MPKKFHDLLTSFCEQLEREHDLEICELQSKLNDPSAKAAELDTSFLETDVIPSRQTSPGSPGEEMNSEPFKEAPIFRSSGRQHSHQLLAMPTREVSPEANGRASRTPELTRSLSLDDDTPHAGIVTSTNEVVNKTITRIFSVEDSLVVGLTQAPKITLYVLEMFASCTILVNTIVIGVSSDHSPDWIGWLITEYIFALCFTSEMSVRMYMIGAKEFFRGRGWKWNMFDLVLTGISVAEAIIETVVRLDPTASNSVKMDFFRMVRLVKIAKITRLTRTTWMTELMMILNGAIGGSRIFFWSLVALSFPIYMVALLLRQLIGDDDPGLDTGSAEFDSTAQAFFTVFRCVVAMDCTDEVGNNLPVKITRNYGWFYGVGYCISSALFIFALSNILTALYVESVTESAKRNDNLHRTRHLADIDHLSKTLRQMMFVIARVHFGIPTDEMDDMAAEVLGQVATLQIDSNLFDALCHEEDFDEHLNTLGIPLEDRHDLFDTLDVEGRGKIGIHNLVHGLAKLRGLPSRCDMVKIQLLARQLQSEQKRFKSKVLSDFKHLEKQMSNIRQQWQAQRQKSLTEHHHQQEQVVL